MERWTIRVGAANIPEGIANEVYSLAVDPEGPVRAQSGTHGPASVAVVFGDIYAELEEEAIQAALDRFTMIPGSSGWEVSAEIEDDRPIA